jgi:CHASE1-domain containing sensor protein
MKKSLAITVAAVALILVVAIAILGVPAALAGQQSGLEKSTTQLPRAAAHAAALFAQAGDLTQHRQ